MTGPSDEAIAAAGRCLAEAELGLRRGTVAEAAARSYGVLSGRVTQADMETRIAAIRAADTPRPSRRRAQAAAGGGKPAKRKSA